MLDLDKSSRFSSVYPLASEAIGRNTMGWYTTLDKITTKPHACLTTKKMTIIK
jgi:hypothetical protein